MSSFEESRYEGRPLLRLLESYVLSSIGHLGEDQEHALNLMAPMLAETFGVRASWFDIVAIHMEFPASLPQKIKQIWEDGLVRANALNFEVHPEEFARQFVDVNFAGGIQRA